MISMVILKESHEYEGTYTFLIKCYLKFMKYQRRGEAECFRSDKACAVSHLFRRLSKERNNFIIVKTKAVIGMTVLRSYLGRKSKLKFM